jgi:release factor glutamine methyltransferase
MAETWTIGRLLAWTTDYLKRHQADSPRLEAEVLLAHALGCARIGLYTAFDEEPSEAVRSTFRELVRRRAEGEPVAYLVGHREFYSLTFRVGPAVLIPRPETETLVLVLIDLVKAAGMSAPAIADVGTGSGVIAICAAKYLPQAQLVAIDTSPEALALARANAADHGVAERIEYLEGDLLGPVASGREFDLIVSNPPYVSDSEWEALAPDVRHYEPRTALVAGPQGTEVIARLIPQAAERLRPGGHLLLEISPMIHEAVLGLLAAEPRLEPQPTVKDLARHPRVVVARRSAATSP